jgi:Putative MetA-pathway of phenol degradation
LLVPVEGQGLNRRRRRSRACLVLALLASAAFQCPAQELEPRAYSPSPVGTHFLVAGYARTSGDVVFDASLPFSDVDAQLNAGTLAYGQTFGVLGRWASVLIAAPYVWGDVSGKVNEEANSITRSGPGDPRLRLSVNLVGGPALTPAEFSVRKPATTLGTSLTVVPPLGEYDPAKLINIGANRWAFKPELGLSFPVGRWSLEGYAGVWLFGDNDEFMGGVRREQDPIGALQFHASYTFRPRLWVAVDSTWYSGGRSTVDGVEKNDRLENTRVGATLSLPIGDRQSLKLTWSDGASTRVGGDFSTFGVAWQYVWLRPAL